MWSTDIVASSKIKLKSFGGIYGVDYKFNFISYEFTTPFCLGI